MSDAMAATPKTAARESENDPQQDDGALRYSSAVHIGWLAVLITGVTAAAAQQKDAWRVDRLDSTGAIHRLVATTSVELPGSTIQLTMVCHDPMREMFLTSSAPLRWQVTQGYPSFRLTAFLDGQRIGFVFLKQEDERAGRVVAMVVPAGAVMSTNDPQHWDRVQRRDPFGGRPMPERSMRFEGLIPDTAVEFRFDALSEEQRRAVHQACFAEDQRRHAESLRLSACLKSARAEAQRALEAAQDEARRQWCDTTREPRREQLISRFLGDVRRARNGGGALASAVAEILATNPDAVVAVQDGSTQTCPDVHFAIDVQLLRPAFARAIGPAATDETISRRLAALLDEGPVVRSMDLRYEVPMPGADQTQWKAVMAAAEASCKAG